MSEKPIGVFDSGLGGISVLNHLTSIMPSEKFIYVADSAWCPYGTKPFVDIQMRSQLIVDFLLKENVKMIVVACNTATAAAIELLRKHYSIPFVGMEPAIKPAALLTKTNTVGVLATKNTFEGALFKETSSKYAKDVNTIIQIGDGLVELVEDNQVNSKQSFELINKYTTPMVNANADYIVLGCTHYPFLTEIINEAAPQLIVIDPALPVAKRAKQLLKQNDLLTKNKTNTPVSLCTTGDISKLVDFAENYMNARWEAETINI